MIVIDMEDWTGASNFTHFDSFEKSSVSVTVEIDITDLYLLSKEKNISLFTLHLYALQKAINNIDAFRYRKLNDGRVVLHEGVALDYLVLNQHNDITGVRAPDIENFNFFCEEKERRETVAKQDTVSNFSKTRYKETAFFSYIPWLKFTSMGQPESSEQESIPIFTMGQYSKRDDRITMPFDIHAHHGFVDGFRIGLLVKELEKQWHKLCLEIRDENQSCSLIL